MTKTNTLVKVLFGLAALALVTTTWTPDADGRGRKRARKQRVQPTKVRPDRLGDGIAQLPFGGSTDDALKWSRKRLQKGYAPRMKAALDGNERARLREEEETRLAEIRNGILALNGQRTGYEVSVISGEYVPGVGESLMRYKDGTQDHYLFFSEGDLYKYARPMSAIGDFKDRMNRFLRDHGEETSIQRLGKGRSHDVEQVVWTGERFQVRLLNRRGLFGADLLVLEDLHLMDRVIQRRGKTPALKSRPDVEPELEDFLE